MAYFANGTEGEMFREHWCANCVHSPAPDGPECPVWALHWAWNSEAVAARNAHYSKETPPAESEAKRAALDLLIPMDTDERAQECAMFAPRAPAENPTRRAHRELRELLGVAA